MISSIAKLDQISEDGIHQLVDAFYTKVRRDPELAPIFLRAIPGDWQPHLNKMYAFWSSVMLTTGRRLPPEPPACGGIKSVAFVIAILSHWAPMGKYWEATPVPLKPS